MVRYSVFSPIRHPLHRHERWQRVWRDPEPKGAYDAVIVGGRSDALCLWEWLAESAAEFGYEVLD